MVKGVPKKMNEAHVHQTGNIEVKYYTLPLVK